MGAAPLRLRGGGFLQDDSGPSLCRCPPKVLPRQALGRPGRCPVLRFVEALGSLLVLTPAACRAEASAGAKPAWLPVLVQFPLLCLMSGRSQKFRGHHRPQRGGGANDPPCPCSRGCATQACSPAGREQHCVWPPAALGLSDVSRIRTDKCAKLPRTALLRGGCAGSRARGHEVGPMRTGMHWSPQPGAACTTVPA